VDTKLGETAIRRIITAMFMLGGLSILVKSLLWRMQRVDGSLEAKTTDNVCIMGRSPGAA
jgi:hypothetical protein